MDLSAIRAAAEAARTFWEPHGDGESPPRFKIRMPPIVEAGDRVLEILRAPLGREGRERALELILDLVVDWADVPLSLFTLGSESSLVPFTREACEQLFLERPDVMGTVAGAAVLWVNDRAKTIAAEKKTSDNSSSAESEPPAGST